MVLLRFLLALSLFMPSLAVYAHELSHHDHKVCEETSIHFHEKEEQCFADDYVLKPTYFVQALLTNKVFFGHVKEVIGISIYPPKYDLSHIFYRGPPTT